MGGHSKKNKILNTPYKENVFKCTFKIKYIMKEIWKDATNYFGDYQVSNFGRVKSIRKIKSTGKTKKHILKPTLFNGYYIVYLKSFNKIRKVKVHQLVFTTFIDSNFYPFNNNLVIDHIDENKLNNKVENLQLLTRAENILKNKQFRKNNGKH
jgi:hypothetical protein